MNREQEIEEKLKEVENLIKVTSSDELMKRSFEDFFSYDNLKRNWKAYILFSIISLVVTILFFYQKEKMEHILALVSYTNDIFLGLLGIVFAGYALVQASLSDRLIKSMFVKSKDKTTDSNGVSLKYTKLNESFFKLMLLYVMAIALNAVTFLVLNNGGIFITWLYVNSYGRVTLYILLCLYIFFFISVLWELKFFIFNLYSLINASVANEILFSIDKEIDEKDIND